VDIVGDFGISGHYVTRALDRAMLFRGSPQVVRADNGLEFTSRAFMAWTQAHGILQVLIQQRYPMQSGDIKGFDGKFRDEQLYECWFQTLHQARMSAVVGARTTTESDPTAA
jgi:putative transposase